MSQTGAPGPGGATFPKEWGFNVATAKKEIVEQHSFPEMQPYDRSMSFSDMALTADEVLGYALLKDEAKLNGLLGVPFLITHVTYRRSFPSINTKGLWMAYVSAECVIADENYLDGYGISLHGKPVRAGEAVVFNDGSTGIARQITKYLHSKGYIELPEGPDEGGKEMSRFDAPPSEWPDVRYGDVRFQEEGFAEYNAEIRLLCPRGLRVSDGYSNDFTDNGTTFYIA